MVAEEERTSISPNPIKSQSLHDPLFESNPLSTLTHPPIELLVLIITFLTTSTL